MSGALGGPASGLRHRVGLVLVAVFASLMLTTPAGAATNVVKATEGSSGTVNVTWTGSTTSATKLVTYLELTATKLVKVQSATAGPGVKRVSVKGLTASKSYRFALESGKPTTAPWARLVLNGNLTQIKNLQAKWVEKDLQFTWTPVGVIPGATIVISVTNQNGAVKQLSVPSSSSILLFSGLDNKKSYTAKAVLRTQSGASTPQSVDVAPALPGVPTVRVSSNSVGVATVAWTPNGPGVAQWLVSVRSEGNNRDGNVIPVAGSQTKLDVDELTPGASYSFRVTGRNTLGDGAASPAMTIIVKSDALPATGLAITPGDRSVVIKWSAGQVASGSPVYRVGHRTSVGVVWKYGESTSSTTATVTGLTNNVNYSFVVDMTTPDGRHFLSSVIAGSPQAPPVKNPDSPSVGPTPTPTGTPAAPSKVTGFQVTASNGAATLTWKDPDKATHLLQWREESTTVWQEMSPSGTTQLIEGLTNGTKYYFRLVRTADLFVVTPTLTATPKGQAGAVVALTARPSHSEARISWQTPLSDGGYTIEAYVITYTGTGVNREITCDNSCRAVTATGLENGYTYTVTVYALTSRGPGVISTVEVVPSAG